MLLCADVCRDCHGGCFHLDSALCPMATGFDRGGVRSSLEKNYEGALSGGQLWQVCERSVTVDTTLICWGYFGSI